MDKKKFQFYYGIILMLIGAGVFYRIPQVMPQIATIEFFSHKLSELKFCFYALGVMLIIVGALKCYKNFK